MRAEDMQPFFDLLDHTYDLIGSGANKVISAGAKAMFFAAVQHYSLEEVRGALNAHMRDARRGQFTPKPADIIAQMEAVTENDGRPGAEEAWAIALAGDDEANTVVWTTETAQAFFEARPVLESSGSISARKTFVEIYTRLVGTARQERRRPEWTVSIGTDKTLQQIAMKKAVTAGQLPAPYVAGLLPPPVGAPTNDENARAQLDRIKAMVAGLEAERCRTAELHELRKAEAHAELRRIKKEVDAQVQARLGQQPGEGA
ncbi:MAG TPA: hypothetical protein VIT92_10595 [Burkholderiaceae bacterium]